MIWVYPDYYKEFHCIADKCRHNCCIGWEIDIDKESLDFYLSVKGDFKDKLYSSISFEGEPHFVLGKDERCPFLNNSNLCDIIINLGEEHICTICKDHPRFRSFLSTATEIGLGLCCEEAARLILGKKSSVRLLTEKDTNFQPEDEAEYLSDPLTQLRDKAIEALQDRSKSIDKRVCDMLSMCSASLPNKSIPEWADVFLSLERLDHAWTDTLQKLKMNFSSADKKAFYTHMKNRQTEFEQLLVYFVYRYFGRAQDESEAAAFAAFAALSYKLIYSIGTMMLNQTGDFSFEDITELARMYSAEVEYSEENINTLTNLLKAK